MKQNTLLMTLVATVAVSLLLLGACGDQQGTESSTPQVSASDVKEKAQEAVETASEFAQQKKDEYLQTLDTKVIEWQQQISDLQAKADAKAAELGEEGKRALDQQIENLKAKQQAAAEKLAEFKSSGADAWTELKTGMDSAMEDLSQAFNDARSQLGDT